MSLIIDKIKSIDPKQFLETLDAPPDRAGKPSCPLCGSGTGKNRTSAFSIKKNYFRCFACNFAGDVIELYMRAKKVEFKKAIKDISAMYGIDDPCDMERELVGVKWKLELAPCALDGGCEFCLNKPRNFDHCGETFFWDAKPVYKYKEKKND
jgi:hypothetical protein